MTDNLLDVTTWLIIVTACLYVLVICRYYISSGQRKNKRYPAGPWGFPVLGHLPLFGKLPAIRFKKWRAAYGDVFSVRMGSWNTVVLNGYDAIMEAADKPDDAFSGRPPFVARTVMEEVYGSSQITLAPFDERLIQNRKLTAKAVGKFTGYFGKSTEQLIIEETELFVKNILAKDLSKPINLRDEIYITVGRVMYKLMYGRVEEQMIQEKLRQILEATETFNEINESGNPADVLPWLEYILPWKRKHLKDSLSTMHKLSSGEIDSHIETYSSDRIRDILDAFFLYTTSERKENGEFDKETRARLNATLDDMQGAGSETISKALRWLLLYIAKFPEVQSKVRKEIDAVVKANGTIEMAKKKEMVYTNAAILETLRVAPLAPFSVPRFTISDTTVAGFDIDQGTIALFNLSSVLDDPVFWRDPENYRPEQFIDVNGLIDKDKRRRVFPFGIGRRRCIGQGLVRTFLFLFLTNFLKKCIIEQPDNEDFDLEPIHALVYAPKEFKVIVKEVSRKV